jgi:hypothetical protein
VTPSFSFLTIVSDEDDGMEEGTMAVLGPGGAAAAIESGERRRSSSILLTSFTHAIFSPTGSVRQVDSTMPGSNILRLLLGDARFFLGRPALKCAPQRRPKATCPCPACVRAHPRHVELALPLPCLCWIPLLS